MKKFVKTSAASVLAMLVAVPAFANTAEALTSNAGMMALASGLAIAIAAVGGSLGQAKTAAAALEGIARNPAAQPKLFIPMIIALALIESLVIYSFVIAFLLKPF